MKLIDLLIQLDNENTSLNKESHISGPVLKSIEKKLFECEEFKNVVRMNFIDAPVYMVDLDTQEPISLNREYLGGEVKSMQVSTFKFKEGDEIKFNRFIDIYSLQIVKTYNTSAVNIDKPGVWIFPTIYGEGFVPKKEIRIIWSPEQLQDALAMMGKTETAKDRLMRMFEDALDSMEPNIPCEYGLIIRGSQRSVLPDGPMGNSPKDSDIPPGGGGSSSV